MSAFWSGALSALLGGVVGGIFTAMAGVLQVKAIDRTAQLQVAASQEAAERQVRSAFEAASYQMKEAHRQQISLMHQELVQKVILEVAQTLETLHREARDVKKDMPASEHGCTIDEVYPFYRDASRKIYRFHWLYGAILPESVVAALGSLTDDVFSHTKEAVDAQARATQAKVAARARRRRVCGYCELALEWSDALWDTTMAVSRTLSRSEGRVAPEATEPGP